MGCTYVGLGNTGIPNSPPRSALLPLLRLNLNTALKLINPVFKPLLITILLPFCSPFCRFNVVILVVAKSIVVR